MKATQITPEMSAHFLNRTQKHISLVNKYYKKYCEKMKIKLRDLKHDDSKFYFPEMLPYVLITWQYHCKDLNIPFHPTENEKNDMNLATEHHIKTNKHHPEFWSERTVNLISREDRDKVPDTEIDVSETMPYDAIIEMCADWCAMSEEKNNTPYDWARNVVNKRWIFGEEKTKVIYRTLRIMWE
jgi:hypothetical protein